MTDLHFDRPRKEQPNKETNNPEVMEMAAGSQKRLICINFVLLPIRTGDTQRIALNQLDEGCRETLRILFAHATCQVNPTIRLWFIVPRNNGDLQATCFNVMSNLVHQRREPLYKAVDRNERFYYNRITKSRPLPGPSQYKTGKGKHTAHSHAEVEDPSILRAESPPRSTTLKSKGTDTELGSESQQLQTQSASEPQDNRTEPLTEPDQPGTESMPKPHTIVTTSEFHA